MWELFGKKKTEPVIGKQFKTNINCQNCINAVTPHLSQVAGIDRWEVDTTSPDKILTVAGTVSEEEVTQAVTNAGFSITSL